MQKLIKILGLLVIAFMFAPLSQCSYVPLNWPAAENQEVVVDTYVAFDEITDTISKEPFSALGIIATFLAPLIVSLFRPTSFRGKILNNIAHLIASGWLLFYAVMIVFLWDTPLVMGYLFTSVAVVLTLMSILTLISTIRKRNKIEQVT